MRWGGDAAILAPALSHGDGLLVVRGMARDEQKRSWPRSVFLARAGEKR
ncbi:MAG: hypothetical protein OJF49_004431 [Ktedonobacterales bacterium]|nr:MAG: hypothetical protein OJF49_004431 [Ktedonobacterales bacterium]